jgi:23S rRNA-/tRNA-specific pseudouridylate synthase
VAGVTEIEVNAAAVTVSVAEPLIEPKVAVIVADPWAMVVAKPPALTVATDVAEEVHVAVLGRV